jgi:PhnB protein
MSQPGVGLIPHLICSPAAAAMDFYAKAFGAKELARVPGPDGKLMHAAMMIGPSTIFLCDDFPEHCGGKSRTAKALGGTPVVLHQNVPDCDAAIARAAEAGAEVTMPAADQFWGDRYGQVTDPFGHVWSFSTPTKK